jgi:hypothetical protein
LPVVAVIVVHFGEGKTRKFVEVAAAALYPATILKTRFESR